ncbi:hypothetical protein LCGC14_2317000 [marine sediment metagenome]|uniref:Uncharacterized protein n=1 Tax=marine sediment metagenome TaxID=412755 RepID=A0A0F9CJ50_9ZZZZ
MDIKERFLEWKRSVLPDGVDALCAVAGTPDGRRPGKSTATGWWS